MSPDCISLTAGSRRPVIGLALLILAAAFSPACARQDDASQRAPGTDAPEIQDLARVRAVSSALIGALTPCEGADNLIDVPKRVDAAARARLRIKDVAKDLHDGEARQLAAELAGGIDRYYERALTVDETLKSITLLWRDIQEPRSFTQEHDPETRARLDLARSNIATLERSIGRRTDICGADVAELRTLDERIDAARRARLRGQR